MKSSGNGNVAQCVANLIATYQGEVPYQRLKGMATDVIDENLITSEPKIKNHATWLIENYEERAVVNDIKVNIDESGIVKINPDISYQGVIDG